jgi:hypothetical protein
MKCGEFELQKLTEKAIIAEGQMNDILFGLKEISCKLDTLIALKQVEVSRQRQQP